MMPESWFTGAPATLADCVRTWMLREFVATRSAVLEHVDHPSGHGVRLDELFVDLPAELPVSGLVNGCAARMLERLARAPDDGENVGIPPVHEDGEPAALRWMLIGGPGQGKSTLLRHVAQVHRAHLVSGGDDDAQAALDKYAGVPCPVPRMPLFVEARIFAGSLPKLGPEALTAYLHDRMAPDVDPAAFGAWLSATPAVLLVDGLDEVAAAPARAALLRAVLRWLSRRPATPVIVSTRPTRADPELAQWPEVRLVALSAEKASDLGRSLVERRFTQPKRRDENLRRFDANRTLPGVAALLTTPLQVAMVVAVLDEGGDAPTERWRLFDRYYDVVERRECARETALSKVVREHHALVRGIHRTAALLLHVRAEVAGHEAATVGRAELGALVRTWLLQEGQPPFDAHRVASEVMAAVTERLVLLVARDIEGSLAFEVRPLQEAMAAEALLKGPDDKVLARFARVIRSAVWRQVVVLAVERLAGERDHRLERVVQLLDEVDRDEVGAIALPGARTAVAALGSGMPLAPRVREQLVASCRRAFAVPMANFPPALFEPAKAALATAPWWEVAGAWRAIGASLGWDELVERLPKAQSERVGLGNWHTGLRLRQPGAFPWWRADPAPRLLRVRFGGSGVGVNLHSVQPSLQTPERVAFREDWALIGAASAFLASGAGIDHWLDAWRALSESSRAHTDSLPWPLAAAADRPANAEILRATRRPHWEAVERALVEGGATVDEYVAALTGQANTLRSVALRAFVGTDLHISVHQDALIRIADETQHPVWMARALEWSPWSPQSPSWIRGAAPFALGGWLQPVPEAVDVEVAAALCENWSTVYSVSTAWALALAPFLGDYPGLVHLVAQGANADVLVALGPLDVDRFPSAHRPVAQILEVARSGGGFEAFAAALSELDPGRDLRTATALIPHIREPARSFVAVARWCTPQSRPRVVLQVLRDAEHAPTGLDHPSVWRDLALPALPDTNAPSLTHPLGAAPPPHLRHLRVTDLGGIRAVDLELPPAEDPDAGQWLILIGANGSGKTTLLRGLALAAGGTLLSATAVARLDPGVVRIGRSKATISVSLVDGTHWGAMVSSSPTHTGTSPAFLAAYGVDRGGALGGPQRDVRFTPWSSVASLFGDRAEGLIHAETWLAQFRAPEPGDWRATVWPALHEALLRLLIGVDRIELRADGIRVHSESLGTIPLSALSDGYLSTLGWAVDLVARWLDHAHQQAVVPGADLLQEMTGLVLLDEIDQHLHPSWQARVIADVRAIFPRMSFVVTTHNPLTLHAALPGEIVVLRRRGTELDARQVDLPAGMDAASILTGPWFDLDTTLDPDTVDLIARHQANVLAGVADPPVEAEVHERLSPLRERLAALRKATSG